MVIAITESVAKFNNFWILISVCGNELAFSFCSHSSIHQVKNDRWSLSFICCLEAIISRSALLHSETPQRSLLLACILNLQDVAAVIGLFIAPLLHYDLQNITQKRKVMKSPPLQPSLSNLKWHFQELFSLNQGGQKQRYFFPSHSDGIQAHMQLERYSLVLLTYTFCLVHSCTLLNLPPFPPHPHVLAYALYRNKHKSTGLKISSHLT